MIEGHRHAIAVTKISGDSRREYKGQYTFTRIFIVPLTRLLETTTGYLKQPRSTRSLVEQPRDTILTPSQTDNYLSQSNR